MKDSEIADTAEMGPLPRASHSYAPGFDSAVMWRPRLWSRREFLMNIVTMHFAPEPFLKVVNESLAARGVLSGTISGGEARRLHRIAWERRFSPVPTIDDERGGLGTSRLDLAALSQVLQTVDRVFVSPQPVREILAYVNWLDALAAARISEFTPGSTLLYARTPHYPWEVAFAIRASRLGHRVLVIRNTFVKNRITLEEGVDFARPNILAPKHHRELPPVSHDDLQSDFLNESKKLNHDMPLSTRIGWWIKLLVWLVVPVRKRARISRVALTRKNQSIFSRTELLLALVKMVTRLARARRFLASAEIVPDAREGFVLVALHYQPEATTDPDGGAFSDQVRFVERLRALLDEAGHRGTRILVREHPRQVARRIPALGEAHFRSIAFYRELVGIDGVLLVARNHRMQDLIRQSLLVATVNGTAAWEALIAGRPAITARRAWFSECSAAGTLVACESDPGRLRELTIMDPDHVRSAFSEFLDGEQYTFLGSNDSADLVADREDWPSFADQMVDGVLDRISE
jgi:hypothetical protein